MNAQAVRPAMRTLEKVPEGVFTQTESARAGVSSRSLYRLRDAGHVESVGRGLYRRASATPVDVDLLEIRARSRQATICLASALARHDLVDAIPGRIDIAIPRGSYPPRLQTVVKWHSFDAATFEVGRGEVAIEGAEKRIGLYSAERSIVDVFRLRGQQGYELGIEALRTWLRRHGAHPVNLLRIARQVPRAEGPVRQALEYLA